MIGRALPSPSSGNSHAHTLQPSRRREHAVCQSPPRPSKVHSACAARFSSTGFYPVHSGRRRSVAPRSNAGVDGIESLTSSTATTIPAAPNGRQLTHNSVRFRRRPVIADNRRLSRAVEIKASCRPSRAAASTSRPRLPAGSIAIMSESASEVRGEYWDCGTPERPLPHVSWFGPSCGRRSDDDLEPDDRQPKQLECGYFPCERRVHTIVWDDPRPSP